MSSEHKYGDYAEDVIKAIELLTGKSLVEIVKMKEERLAWNIKPSDLVLQIPALKGTLLGMKLEQADELTWESKEKCRIVYRKGGK